ncbi:uncharacterized protein LOC114172271 [Vigna unguiculata]|uniref:uncharacterized protein LOC114172271 n=1 Tax=Vigna unguiculata TaxID=3917 RepID=UPI001015F031|nr:uncharacterized protein LOC114172271 [Vigna unguiculata]
MARRSQNSTNSVDEMAQAIQRLVDAMQHQQPQAVHAPVQHNGMNEFMRHKPPKFDGKATPDEADAWIREIEKIFRVLGCSNAQKLEYAIFLLNGEAEYWWGGMQRMMEARNEVIDWTSFRTKFMGQYFPDSARHEREAEFLTLLQRDKSVQAYVDRFEYLARFYSQNMSEEWRCRKFERGLRHNLMKVIMPMRIREFPLLVEQAKMIEQLEADPHRVMRSHPGNNTGGRQQKKPYSRPQRGGQGLMKCYECGGAHLRRNCPKLHGAKPDERKCYNCQKPGHFANSCPEKKSGAPPQQQKSFGEKTKAAGRVFAMSGSEANKSGKLIQDTCLLFGERVNVLFDSGASHSFVSLMCSERLGLPVRDLGCELVVSTPASGQVSTSSVCVGCPIEIAGRKFTVNLVRLPLEGLDVILGMDWLTTNDVIIDCGKQKVVVPDIKDGQIVKSRAVIQEIREGAECYVVWVEEEKPKNTEEKITGIPVVEEFADVFPEEVPGLPPSREVEFAIDLVPGAGPVSVAPYRMAPAELAELKKQLEDLLEKKFIRPSVSPWGAPVLLVKRRMGVHGCVLTTDS